MGVHSVPKNGSTGALTPWVRAWPWKYTLPYMGYHAKAARWYHPVLASIHPQIALSGPTFQGHLRSAKEIQFDPVPITPIRGP